MATAPQFATTPRIGIGQVNTANTNRDGTGTLATVLVAGSAGTTVTHIIVEAITNTAAGIVRVFLDDGTNVRLFYEFVIAAITVSGTVAGHRDRITGLNLTLPAGWSIKASVHNSSETINVIAVGADL